MAVMLSAIKILLSNIRIPSLEMAKNSSFSVRI
jgi:hypothetical protein